MLMTPGLAFFYGGLAKSDGVLTLMFQNFVALGVVSLVWFVVGFSLAFGEDAGTVIGNPATFAFMRNLDGGPMMIDGEVIIGKFWWASDVEAELYFVTLTQETV